jgi:hypothetical protein
LERLVSITEHQAPARVAYRPGDRDDFDRLYRVCYPRLLRILYAITGDSAAAEDCVRLGHNSRPSSGSDNGGGITIRAAINRI